jgi:hypothetical protein
MSSLHAALFRVALRAFPATELADEMQLVFEERYEEKNFPGRAMFALSDCLDVVVSGFRMRIADYSPQPALPALVVVAMLATTVAIRGVTKAPSRFDFYGADPRGAFTLTVVEGKAVAATLDRSPIPRDRIVQRGDSIALFNRDGERELAVRFDADHGQISWGARR